ncbi:cell wall protein Ecm33 [Diplodia seriata]|uniref:Cell wall protein Ecm33 n=1 Tax=Diplodia seriata TaxID=420778 RepID=A0ABR3BXD6_9PEZI
MRTQAWTLALQALLVGRALADDCSTTVTITTTAPAMASCSTFSGDVVIASTFSGELNLTSVETIAGRVIATSVPNLEAIRLPAIVSVEGVEVSDAPKFNTFDFALNSNADHASLGDIDFSDLASFPGFTFQYVGGISNLTYNNVSSDYLWFSWEASNVAMGDVVLTNNALLENVSIPFASGDEISVTSNDVMGYVGFDYMSEIAAATITANPSMTQVWFPSLTAVAGDFILHASHDVYLDLNSTWSFDEDVVVNGTVTVTYDADAGDEYKCAEITPGVLTVTCNGQVLSATSTDAGGTSATAGAGNGAASTRATSNHSATASSSTSSSGLTTTVKIGVGIGVALGVIGIVAIISAILLLLRMRKKRAVSRDGTTGAPDQGQQGGGAALGEQKLPPPYAQLWRGRSTKKHGSGYAEPMMQGHDGQGVPMQQYHQQQQGPQELHGSQGVPAHELESPRLDPVGFAPMMAQGQQQQHAPVEMEGDQNWRRSELMAEPVVPQSPQSPQSPPQQQH